MAVIYADGDTIGTASRDEIYGGSGADAIDGRGGNDGSRAIAGTIRFGVTRATTLSGAALAMTSFSAKPAVIP